MATLFAACIALTMLEGAESPCTWAGINRIL